MKVMYVGGLVAALAISAGNASAQGVTDPQIAAIVVTANQVDIDAGKLAAARGTDPEVNKSATELVTKLKVKPEENATSKALQAGGDKNLANLKSLKGGAFDQAYIDNEVAYHQQVLDAVDKTLIPSASNAELKALLVKVRPAFVAHLEHAKQLQSSLAKSK
jgi:putative membrane protein